MELLATAPGGPGARRHCHPPPPPQEGPAAAPRTIVQSAGMPGPEPLAAHAGREAAQQLVLPAEGPPEPLPAAGMKILWAACK